MISAHNFVDSDSGILTGAMHTDLDGSASGRPQIVTEELDPFMAAVLEELSTIGVDAVINTSLNVHGEPIVQTQADVFSLHERWLVNCPGRFVTYIVKEN